MIEMWTYRTDVVLQPAVELVGFGVEARDGSIGKVDESTADAGKSYLVVDTGPWIFGRKVLLPAQTVERIDLDARTVFVDRTKEEIKNAPEFDPERGSTPRIRTSSAGTTVGTTRNRKVVRRTDPEGDALRSFVILDRPSSPTASRHPRRPARARPEPARSLSRTSAGRRHGSGTPAPGRTRSRAGDSIEGPVPGCR